MSLLQNSQSEFTSPLPEYEPEIILVSESSSSEYQDGGGLIGSDGEEGLDVPTDLVAYLLNEEKEFELPISKRTRANFPLTDVSIDQLDKAAQQLVAPNETAWDVFRDDQEWNNFLDNLNNTPQFTGWVNEDEEDDDDDDFDAELEELFSDFMKDVNNTTNNVWEVEGVQLGTPCTESQTPLQLQTQIVQQQEKELTSSLQTGGDGMRQQDQNYGWNVQLLRQLHCLACAHVQLLLHTHVLTAANMDMLVYHQQSEILIRRLDQFRLQQIQYRIVNDLACYDDSNIFVGNNSTSGWKPMLGSYQTQVGSVIDVGVLPEAVTYLNQQPCQSLLQYETLEQTITSCLGLSLTRHLNPALFPTTTTATKSKYGLFMEEEDILLAHGIVRFGKNWDLIRDNILVGKHSDVIWRRAKNLQARSGGDNPVKRALNLCTGPLRLVELCIINKCIQEQKNCEKSVWEEATMQLFPFRTSEQWLAKNWKRTSRLKSQIHGQVHNYSVLQQVLHPPSSVVFPPKGRILPGTNPDFIHIIPFVFLLQTSQQTQQEQQQIVEYLNNQKKQYLSVNQQCQLTPRRPKQKAQNSQKISKKKGNVFQAGKQCRKSRNTAITKIYNQQQNNVYSILNQQQYEGDYGNIVNGRPLFYNPVGGSNLQCVGWSECEDKIIMRGVLSKEYNGSNYLEHNYQFFMKLTQEVNRECQRNRSTQQVQSRGQILLERFLVMRWD